MLLPQATYCSEGVANADPLWRYSWCYYPNQRIVQRGWQMLIPYEDIVDVITPINILFRGGGKCWSLMKIKLMLLPQSTYCSEGVANADPLWRYSWCYYPNQHIVQRGWQMLIPYEDIVDVITPINILFRGGWKMLIPYEDKVDVITPINILFRGGSKCWSLMKIKLMLLPQSTYCSEGVANADPLWRYSWCYYPNQHIVQRGWQMLIPYEDIVDVITPINILFRGGGKCWSLMKI